MTLQVHNSGVLSEGPRMEYVAPGPRPWRLQFPVQEVSACSDHLQICTVSSWHAHHRPDMPQTACYCFLGCVYTNSIISFNLECNRMLMLLDCLHPWRVMFDCTLVHELHSDILARCTLLYSNLAKCIQVQSNTCRRGIAKLAANRNAWKPRHSAKPAALDEVTRSGLCRVVYDGRGRSMVVYVLNDPPVPTRAFQELLKLPSWLVPLAYQDIMLDMKERFPYLQVMYVQ